MNKTIKFATMLTVAAMLASCAKEAPSKSEVEAGFTPSGIVLPELTVSSSVDCDPMEGVAEVQLTISGLSSTEGITVGVLSSTDEGFVSSNFVKVDNPSEGTVTATAKVQANRTYYIMAAAYSASETVYSNVVTVSVPDIPFWAKIAGTYSATVTSLRYDDEYANEIVIILDEEDPENKCIIGNLEPYYYDNDYSISEGYNYVFADIDNENEMIVIPVGASFHLGGRMYYGLNAADLASASSYAPGVLYFNDAENALIRPYAFYTVVNGSVEDAYGSAVYVKK